jgi:hypothetical protein
MLKRFHATYYLDLARFLSQVEQIIVEDTHRMGGPEPTLANLLAGPMQGIVPAPNPEESVRLFLSGLKHACVMADLQLSAKLIGNSLENDLPQTPRELRILHNQTKNEMEQELYLQVPHERAPYWQMLGIVSDDAKDKFPGAALELRSAGNCYALDLPTACVFHCMRALEFGLGALAKDVHLVWAKEQWHNIIEMIESKLKSERETLPRGLPKDERLNFLSQAAKEFFYFKDGWRNYVSHNRLTYDETQAFQIFGHVRAFIEHLCRELRE